MAMATRTERLALTRKAYDDGVGTTCSPVDLAEDIETAFYDCTEYETSRNVREELASIDSRGEVFTSRGDLLNAGFGIAAMTAAANRVGALYGLRVGMYTADGLGGYAKGWAVTIQAECPEDGSLTWETVLPADGCGVTRAAKNIAARMGTAVRNSVVC